jgi:hypothetical protein
MKHQYTVGFLASLFFLAMNRGLACCTNPLVEEDWNDSRRMEKEDTISVQWAQEDVKTSYNLLNNNTLWAECTTREY